MAGSIELKSIDREAERMVKDIGIPPCPTIVTTFVKEMRTEEPDYRRLSQLISSDAALAAAVLKTVNSPFYGLRSKAANVHQACTFLGLRATAFLITSLLLRRAFPSGDSRSIERFWRESTAMATSTAAIAQQLPGVDRDEAYTFGLFRDCGSVVLLARYPDYGDVFEGTAAKPDTPITQIEDSRYPMNHAHVGCLLAQSWYLPPALCDAILHHHDATSLLDGTIRVARPALQFVAIGLVAEQVRSLNLHQVPCAEWVLGRPLVQSVFGLSDDDVAALAAESGVEEASV